MSVHLDVDVEHGNVSERLGLESGLRHDDVLTENSMAWCMFSNTASIRIASSIFFWASMS